MSRISGVAVLIASVLALAGCVSREEAKAAWEARMRLYLNLTMSQFMKQTGLLPSDAYTSEGNKIFVVLGPAVSYSTPPYTTAQGITVAPGVTRTEVCRILLETKHVGPPQGNTPDNWVITGLNINGPCNNVL